MNGDGFDDVIAGAYLSDASGPDAGSAYVYDCNRYFVTSPLGGDTWNVGATEVITRLGAEPADVWLSADGGDSYSMLRANVGGGAENAAGLTVPHRPTRFAMVRVTPHDGSVSGSAENDSLFTIDASITLQSFRAAFLDGSDGHAVVTWQTDPEPEDLAAFRLERDVAGSGWRMLTETRKTEYVDTDAAGGSRYRLTAINGLGAEIVLGETTLGLISPLAASPLPYRGGELRITFGPTGGVGGGTSRADVSLFDVTGRKVSTVAGGEFPAGYHLAIWDGTDDGGRRVSSGIYFLRVETPGNRRTQVVTVIR